MEYVLQTKDLTKVFGKRAAVSGMNLNVYKGDIYGFIGRNGAGKTTFIRMVAGLARPSKGTIQLFGSNDLDTQRSKTGTMIENPAVFPQMTAKQNLHYYCRLLGLDPVTKIPEMLNLVGLSDTGKKKAKNFSLGISLLGDPEFLMLDEPINGLDPTGIKEIRELILHLNRERKITILISSHILGELSRIANRYGVINNGIMVTEFTNEELEQRCAGELEIKVDKTAEAVDIITGMMEKDAVKVLDEHTIRVSKNLEKAGAINTELTKNGITVNSSSIVGQDLEAYFMQLMESTEKSYV